MKKILFILLLIPTAAFSNQDSILIYFNQILNEYRKNNNLPEIYVNDSLKSFSDSHAHYISTIEYSHGSGENDFDIRVIKFGLKEKYKFMGENITPVFLPDEKFKSQKFKTSDKEIEKIINNSTQGKSTNYEIAKYCFLMWKNSKSHNELMLSQKIKYFYLSYEIVNCDYMFAFITVG